MRLNRLDLIRYGRFQDAQLSFAPPAPGAPDVTLVFGPNEAGKSTAFEAYLEFLFGMKKGEHPYAFRFDRADLMVGAELAIPGRGEITLRRNSKSKETLLDAAGLAVDEAVLASALSGLTREAYVERLSLNDRSLREGGARIAKAEGDLGELLHAGLTGLPGLSEALGEIEARAAAFHRKGAQKSTLAQGKKRLNEIAQALKAQRLTPQKEAALLAGCARAAEAFGATDAALIQARQRAEAAKAAQLWWEAEAEIAGLAQKLAALPEGESLPEGAAQKIGALIAKCDAQRAQAAKAQAAVARSGQELDALPLDPEAERFASEIARFEETQIDGATLESRARTAEVDLGRRTAEQSQLEAQMQARAAQLGVAAQDQARLILSTEALDALTEAVDAALRGASAVDARNAEAKRLRQAIGAAPAEPRDMAALQDALERWQGAAQLAGLEEALRGAKARLSEAELGLPPSWQDLLRADLPTEQALTESAARAVDLAAQLKEARSRAEAAEAEALEAEKACAALSGGGADIDAAAIEASRRARDLAWEAHLRGLDRESAEAFEARMRDDDTARAQFYSGAAARDRLAQAREAEAKASARYDTARARRAELERAHDAAAAEIAAQAQALGFEGAFAAGDLGPRRARLGAAQRAATQHAEAQEAWAQAAEREKAARAELKALAAEYGIAWPEAGFERAIATVIAAAGHDQERWQRWRTDQEALREIEAGLEAATDAAALAAEALERLSEALPLPDRRAEALRRALPVLRLLSKEAGDLAGLNTRITDMQQALHAARAAAERLAQLGAEAQDSPLATIAAAKTRLEAAREAARRAAALRGAIEAAEGDEAEAARALAAAQADLDALFEGQGGSEIAAAERLELLLRRDTLRAEHAAQERARGAARAAVEAGLFEEELALLPSAARAAEVAQMVRDAQAARDAALAAKTEAERVYDAALSTELRADLATEAAGLREHLRDAAYDAAVARLGVLAARGALRRLAAERRGDMLKDVERAFVQMTAPKWRGVDVWSESAGDKLVGIAADGTATPAEKMSTGTMGQLYFALRLAGYKAFARSPGPLPMVLDDIMETFDDARARAALMLCAEIGSIGQAIMFTHHQHLVEMAQALLPGVAVIDLQGVG